MWYRWTAPSAGEAIFSTFGSTFDTDLAVYTGTSMSSLTLENCSDDYIYPYKYGWTVIEASREPRTTSPSRPRKGFRETSNCDGPTCPNRAARPSLECDPHRGRDRMGLRFELRLMGVSGRAAACRRRWRNLGLVRVDGAARRFHYIHDSIQRRGHASGRVHGLDVPRA